MSIYFQYPAINDYPNVNHAAEILEADIKKIKDEDNMIREEIKELKDFLALKPV
ncbi:hypothetical protein [Pedobacter aquatilis]|uniref:hypothetical protein n=1 Tax=Pedobacter aquatilis TaxID=351343 RepID=UPI00292E1D21|nr:hypothetical protein [Pedobacter aquatilis]